MESVLSLGVTCQIKQFTWVCGLIYIYQFTCRAFLCVSHGKIMHWVKCNAAYFLQFGKHLVYINKAKRQYLNILYNNICGNWNNASLMMKINGHKVRLPEARCFLFIHFLFYIRWCFYYFLIRSEGSVLCQYVIWYPSNEPRSHEQLQTFTSMGARVLAETDVDVGNDTDTNTYGKHFRNIETYCKARLNKCRIWNKYSRKNRDRRPFGGFFLIFFFPTYSAEGSLLSM